MKLIDKDALLAEIDKRMEHLTPHAGQGVILTKVLKDHYEDLRNFINRMSEEPASKDLEEEYQRFLKEEWFNNPCKHAMSEFCVLIARHFANWQKEQMMKNAVEATYIANNMIRQNKITHPLHVGDKIKIIILNEE